MMEAQQDFCRHSRRFPRLSLVISYTSSKMVESSIKISYRHFVMELRRMHAGHDAAVWVEYFKFSVRHYHTVMRAVGSDYKLLALANGYHWQTDSIALKKMIQHYLGLASYFFGQSNQPHMYIVNWLMGEIKNI
jgi:hypothetical protein